MLKRRRRRRGITIGKILGLLCCLIGTVIMIYVIPFKIWILLFGIGFLCVGIVIFHV